MGALLSLRVFSVRSVALSVAVLMGVAALLALGTSISGYYDGAQKTVSRTQAQSEAFAKALSEQFIQAQALIDERLPALEENPSEALAWLEDLRAAVAAQQSLSILSFGVAFEPQAYRSDQRLFAPMYLKVEADQTDEALMQLRAQSANAGPPQPLIKKAGKRDQYNIINLHNIVDYTLPFNPQDPESYDSRWYELGLNAPQDRGLWQQPYYGEIIKSMLSEYSRPFYGTHPVTGQRQRLGMVYLDLSLDEVRESLQNLDLPAGAYGVLLTDQAYLVSHPIRHWLGKPLSETMAALQPEIAETITEKVTLGESFMVSFHDPHSEQAFTAIHSSIPSNQWSFGLTLAQDSLYTFTARQRLGVLFAFFGFGVALLAFLIYRADGLADPLAAGWRISYLAVGWALLMSVLTLILFVSLEQSDNYIKLLNPTDLSSLPGLKQSRSVSGPKRIPTGVMVEDIRFLRHDEITITGMVWQVLPPDIDDELLGVEFSRNQFDKTHMEKIFETPRQGKVVHGWRFSTAMRYQTNVGQYPFDRSLISLGVTPKDRQSNVILVPDFKAYDFMVPSSLPGIDDRLRLKYWAVKTSYFAKRPYPSLGGGYHQYQQGVKQGGMQRISISDHEFNNPLLFNIEMSRKWLSPIVAYVLPIFIGSIMIFIVLMIPHDRSSGVVFSTLSYGSTIYFVISIFHVGLRNSEGIDGLTYLESYYIIMHAMVMLVSLNGFLLMINKGPSWLFYRDNAVPRMLYWPTITLGLLIMTLMYFAVPSVFLL